MADAVSYIPDFRDHCLSCAMLITHAFYHPRVTLDPADVLHVHYFDLEPLYVLVALRLERSLRNHCLLRLRRF